MPEKKTDPMKKQNDQMARKGGQSSSGSKTPTKGREGQKR